MIATSLLQTFITEASILRLSGDTYFKRGVDYCRRELVDDLEQIGDALTATVYGTEDYVVRLSASGKKLTHFCSCPLGEDGQFCKHLVATALTWLHREPIQIAPLDPLRAVLQAQDKETLIGWIVDWSSRDDAMRRQVLALTGPGQTPKELIADTGRNLKEAIRITGYRDYDQAPVYAGRVHSALDALETLLQDYSAAVIPICETAMASLSKNAEKIDDSDGQMTELMGRVGEIHLQACQQARPDPERLGVRLFALQLGSVYNEWHDAANLYADILGEAGLAAYRREAEKAWEKVPVRTERDVRGDQPGYYAITHIMKSLAQRSGDVEQIVAVLERDLTTPFCYLAISQVYLAAGHHDEALRCAERGMAAFPTSDASSLRLFAAQEYRRTERHAEALHIVWGEFRILPQLESYRRLADFACHADDWENADGWRERAISYIRRVHTEDPANSGRPPAPTAWHRQRLRSLLVEVFLDEGRVEQAWEEAQTTSCDDALWLALAAEREKTQPEDAVSVYLRIAEDAIRSADHKRYAGAVVLLEKAAKLMQGLNQSLEFQETLEAIRLRNKAKSKLRTLIEARRAYLYLD